MQQEPDDIQQRETILLEISSFIRFKSNVILTCGKIRRKLLTF